MRNLIYKGLSVLIFAQGIIFVFTAAAWATTIDITGNYVDPDARVVYTVGTGHDDNPAIGLDFYAEGALTYDYSMTYDIEATANNAFFAGDTGKTVNVQPTLSLSGPTFLTTQQDVNSGTDFFFGIDTWLTGDFYYEAGLPDIDVGGVSATLNNSGTLLSTGSSFEDKSASWGPGTGIVSGGSDTMFESLAEDAWSIDVDLFRVVDALVPIDWILDLDLGLGMDIVQESNLMALLGYDFDLPSLTLDIADGTAAGVYTTSLTGTLNYDLAFQSAYDYSGNAHLNFDAPLIDPINLWDLDLGQFDVGTVTNFYSGSMDVLFDVAYEVFDPALCTQLPIIGLRCLDPVPQPKFAPPLPDSFLMAASTTYTTERIDYPVDVPEPTTLALMTLGLAGLGFKRKLQA